MIICLKYLFNWNFKLRFFSDTYGQIVEPPLLVIVQCGLQIFRIIYQDIVFYTHTSLRNLSIINVLDMPTQYVKCFNIHIKCIHINVYRNKCNRFLSDIVIFHAFEMQFSLGPHCNPTRLKDFLPIQLTCIQSEIQCFCVYYYNDPPQLVFNYSLY